MEKLLYYLFLKPLSALPLSFLYILSDVMFMLFFWLIQYRKKVVLENLRNSFPEKTEAEIQGICKEFYRHFCDLIVESVRLFSMSQEELVARCKLRNPGFFQKYAEAGKSLIVIGGHFNNWEIAAVAFDLQIPHHTVGIYKPLNNAFFNKKLQESRSKYGLGLVPIKGVKAYFQANVNNLTATIFGADQSPSRTTNVYWTEFLNQDTAVLFGSEKYAKEFDYPVVFGSINKLRRGYYDVLFETLEDHPVEAPQGTITEKHTRALEKQIQANPPYWLWTHKRWKRKREATAIVPSSSSNPDNPDRDL